MALYVSYESDADDDDDNESDVADTMIQQEHQQQEFYVEVPSCFQEFVGIHAYTNLRYTRSRLYRKFWSAITATRPVHRTGQSNSWSYQQICHKRQG